MLYILHLPDYLSFMLHIVFDCKKSGTKKFVQDIAKLDLLCYTYKKDQKRGNINE